MNYSLNSIDFFRRLKQLDVDSYYVGGCVRDSLLKVSPNDYDFVTRATPDEVKSVFPEVKSVGENFKVLLVNYNEDTFQVTCDPNLYSDVRRRDFTINSILCDPIEKKYIDYQGGIQDISNRLLRFSYLNVEKIQEDPIRMLRYVRFLVKYGLNTLENDRKTIIDYADLLRTAAPERIYAEFLRILRNPKRGESIAWLNTLFILPILLPFSHVYNELDPGLHSLMSSNHPSEPLILSQLFLSAPRQTMESWMKESRVSTKTQREAIEIRNKIRYLISDQPYNIVEMRKIYGSDLYPLIFEFLSNIVCPMISGLEEKIAILKDEKETIYPTKEAALPEPYIDGNVLLSCGYEGETVGRMKEAFYNLQLRGAFKSKEKALNFLRKSKRHLNMEELEAVNSSYDEINLLGALDL